MATKNATAPVRARRIPNAKPGEVVDIDAKRATTSAEADKARSDTVAAKAKTKEEAAKLKAAKAAEKKAAREEAAKIKAATTAKVEKTLEPIASLINARLEKVAMIEGKADDHRLAAAIHLEECRQKCEEAGISFKKWAEANIKNQSYENIRKLVYIGSYPEKEGGPAKALEDLRNRNKAANKALREKKAKVERKNVSAPENNIAADPSSKGSKRTDSPFQRAEAGLAELKPEQAVELLRSQASQLGHQLLTDKEVKGLKSGGGSNTVDGINSMFDALKAADRLMVIDHIERKTGLHLISDDDFKMLQAAKKTAKKAA